jgi:hypothetical protein
MDLFACTLRQIGPTSRSISSRLIRHSHRIAASVLFTALVPVAFCEYALSTREGNIAYFGSTRVFVGAYTWPTDREPLGVYTPTSALNLQYDHSRVTCDPATDVCTAPGHNLPNGTAVKFGTTGLLPAPLKSWAEDHGKVYQIVSSTQNTFKLAAGNGGSTVDITSAGSGIHGMSFAGYSHVVTLAARFVRPMTCDPASDICTVAGGHGYTDGTGIFLLNEGGKLPSPLMRFFDSRQATYCVVVVDQNRFQLRVGDPDVACPKIAYGQNKALINCNVSSNKCTYPDGLSLSNGLKIKLSSTGTLPQPLNSDVTYYATAVDAANHTFEIETRVNAHPNVDLTSAGTGVVSMEAVVEDITDPGSGVQYASYVSGQSIYIHDIQGYPKGTIFSFRRNDMVLYPPILGKRGYGSIVGSNGIGTLIAKVPALTAPGAYPIVITLSETSSAGGSNLKSLTYTLKAMSLSPLPRMAPSAYPAIPGLAKWEFLMTSATQGGGGAPGPSYPRCPDRINPAAGTGPLSVPSIEAKVWYYDGAANYFEISRWPGISGSVTDQALWAKCGEYIAGTIRDAYLKAPSQHPWTYFPRGLYLAYEWTKDPAYKTALIAIADNGNAFRGVNNEFAMREHAYAFERRLYRQYVTGETDHNLQYYADVAIGMLQSHTYGDDSRTFLQPFMAGLLSRPLVEYYSLYRDERIPVVLKSLADKFWADWYNKETHKMLYNTEPYGARCTVSCQEPVASNLNNLVAPIFAFVWRLTGDDLYRQRGDILFSNVFKDGTPWDPKQWNQAYYWAWEFVRWRQGQDILPTPRVPR